MAKKTTTEAVVGATLEERLTTIESYINKDIRKRKQQKRELKKAKRETTSPDDLVLLNRLDDTDNEEELG